MDSRSAATSAAASSPSERPLSVHDQASAYLALVDRLRSGETLPYSDIRDALGVRESAARVWIQRLVQDAPAAAVREGRYKVLRPLSTPTPNNDLAVGLQLAVDALRLLDGTPYHEALKAEAARQARTLNRPEKLAELSASVAVVPCGAPAEPQSNTLSTIFRALSRRSQLSFSYLNSQGEESERRVLPMGILLRGDHVLLAARIDGPSGYSYRHFRVDRITGRLRTHRPSRNRTLPEDWRLDKAIRDSWGVWVTDASPTHVEVEVREHWVPIFERFKMHLSQQITPSEREGHARVSWRVRPCMELENFLMSLVPDVLVLEPPGLHDRLLARCAEARPAWG